MKFKRIAIDISKHVFTLHGVDEQERPVLRRDLKRTEVDFFFGKLEGTEVVIEACGGAHYWGRVLTRLGHKVRLIPAQYVRPFVRRAKNDRTDAEAINDAASRPGMPCVPLKTAQHQAELIILKHREMLKGQRTQAINALRGHAAEFGLVAAKGTAQVQPLLDKLAADPAIPAVARAMFMRIGEHIAGLDRQIAAVDADLLAQHKANPVSQLLAEVPGIGPITAITLARGVEPAAFASGRHFAAWLGLTPKEHSTGGKQRLGRISKAGNERLRSLLVVGAMAVIRHAKPGKPSTSAWLLALLARKPRKLAAVALANKTARIVWAMMARGEAYRRRPVAA
ncbi:MAG: IS110 family transposase [Bradyrhizobium sp.]|nr:IS110 family transposase [Bradyrhizobium sp.]